jgi:polyhydroxyalkanoate synthase subunit PhaC
MTGQDADKGQAQPMDGTVPGPDVMLRLWASWMDQMSAPAHTLTDPGTAWWQMTTNNPASSLIDAGVDQLQRSLSQDPTLRSIDQMWNANPLREVVPVDWAEIARALRTVWLRSLRKPETANAIVDFNTDLWRSAQQVWHEAGQRWLGLADATPTQGPVSASADKRFAAPEWHTNPVYRTLKEVYLLASDWLLKGADADDGMDEAERQRIKFHLRQFVDAMSPTLMLISNPAALHKLLRRAAPALSPAPAT